MARSFLQVDTAGVDRWRPIVTAAAHDALAAINTALRPGESHAQLQLDGVDVADARVGGALCLSGTAEISHYDDRRPSAYATVLQAPFVLLRPPHGLSHLWTLPSPLHADVQQDEQQLVPPTWSRDEARAGPHGPDELPVFPEFEVEGPLVLYLDQLLYDPDLRLPRRVDAGAARLFKVGPGVRLRVRGVQEMRLRSAIDVQGSLRLLDPREGDEDDDAASRKYGAHHRMAADASAAPEIELRLANDGQHFRVWSAHGAEQRIKVKRVGPAIVELLATAYQGRQGLPTSALMAATDRRPGRSKHAWVLSRANLLNEAIDAFEHMAKTDQVAIPEQATVLRRIVQGKAEVVDVMVIPLHLKDPLEGGHVSQWQVVVSRGADGRNNLMSHQQLVETESVSVSPALLHNTTWPALMRVFPVQRSRAAI